MYAVYYIRESLTTKHSAALASTWRDDVTPMTWGNVAALEPCISGQVMLGQRRKMTSYVSNIDGMQN